MLSLLIVQVIWLTRSLSTARQEFERDIYMRMERIAAQMADDAACFELFSRYTIEKGEEFYLLSPRQPEDTIQTYYWKVLP